MDGYEILKKLSLGSAQETSQMADFKSEVEERLKDLDFITKDDAGADCLLIGASPSEMAAWRRKFNNSPTGISLDAAYFENPESKFDIKKMDMHDLSFSDNSFDFVYGSQVLEHSPAPIIVLIQINRVLKDGGRGFFWIPTDEYNRRAAYHYSCFPKEIWEDLLGKSGFFVNTMVRRGNSWGYGATKIKCLN